MSATPERILEEALRFPPAQRAAIAEGLLSSLDEPDPEIDKLWAEEAEARIDAAQRGAMETVSEQEVFAKWEKS